MKKILRFAIGLLVISSAFSADIANARTERFTWYKQIGSVYFRDVEVRIRRDHDNSAKTQFKFRYDLPKCNSRQALNGRILYRFVAGNGYNTGWYELKEYNDIVRSKNASRTSTIIRKIPFATKTDGGQVFVKTTVKCSLSEYEKPRLENRRKLEERRKRAEECKLCVYR